MKNIVQKYNLKFLLLLLLISVLIGASNYIRLPLNASGDVLAFGAHAIILTFSFFGVLYLISINRYSFILLFAPIVLIASISAWCLYIPNIAISSAIIEVLLNTHWSISAEYLSFEMIAFFILLLVAIAVVYYLRLNKGKLFSHRIYIHYILAMLFVTSGVIVDAKRSNTISSRVPFSVISAFKEYQIIQEQNMQKRVSIGKDAVCLEQDSLSIVFIIGESVRNDHLGINGYKKETTPNLKALNVVSFYKTRSLYTHTAASVPQILTRADSLMPEKSYSEESFIKIFKQCGFDTYWFANQTPDYTYDGIAKSVDHYIPTSVMSSVYSDKLWTDENILEVFDSKISKSTKQKLIVLHTIGSHWYYNYRYDDRFKKFIPVSNSRSIHHNTSEELINSYDNSILYMDYFVSEIIKKMEDENCILIYLSDHGELLGEKGKWLHAVEHDVLRNAACFVWMSDKYKRKHSDKEIAMKDKSSEEITTSFLFHSILDAGAIQTNCLDSLQSIFNLGN
ncbi:DUF1705 domain-containing protein [Marinilabiliaceae bacterium JC017]|nr:DUF1705 domain-containing protein [Marinilabiliaceae bacterium JC017]